MSSVDSKDPEKFSGESSSDDDDALSSEMIFSVASCSDFLETEHLRLLMALAYFYRFAAVFVSYQ